MVRAPELGSKLGLSVVGKMCIVDRNQLQHAYPNAEILQSAGLPSQLPVSQLFRKAKYGEKAYRASRHEVSRIWSPRPLRRLRRQRAALVKYQRPRTHAGHHS